MKVYTRDEVKALFDMPAGEAWSKTRDIVNKWLKRGDGIAVYENQNIGSANLGHRQFVSYGSEAAQLPTGPCECEYDVCLADWANPPVRMPDVGAQINWAYQLAGVYCGEAL